MDQGSGEDGGGGKKKGLARLAKTCQLSNSLNNLNSIDKITERKDENGDHDARSEDHFSDGHQISPTKSLGKPGGPVNLLPNKVDFSRLSGHHSERKSRGVSLDEHLHSELYGHTVPCSDPDFVRSPKVSIQGPQSQGPINYKSSQAKEKSPLLARRSQLSPPQIKRSNSMTRLTQAINQIHNICIFPAQPLVVKEKSEASSISSSSVSPQSFATFPSPSEVMSCASLTPLTATQLRSNKVRTQSPKLARCSAFRKSLKEHSTVPCTESLSMPVSQSSECLSDRRTRSSSLTSALSDCSLKGLSRSSTNLLDDDLCGFLPLETKFSLCSNRTKVLAPNNDDASNTECMKLYRNKPTPHGSSEDSGNEGVPGHSTIKKSSSSPSDLTQASFATKCLMRHCQQQYRIASFLQIPEPILFTELNKYLMGYSTDVMPGTQITCSTDTSYKTEESSLQSCRSASLDELSSISGLLPGLPSLSPADAKRRNYLFGGLGNGSLLGSKELDRYFPNRSLTVFIATWNMNGKEPPANLEEFLLPEAMDHVPDMYVVGTQESGGSRSEWEVRLQATIGPSHALFTSAIFGVLHLTIFMRRDLLWFCSVPEEDTYSLRPGIAYKTKGGMAIGFQFFGTRFLFINSHLTAHEEKQSLRIQNFKNICQSLDLPRLLPQKGKHKDITQRYDVVFWLGDLNFRLAVNRDHVFERLKRAGPETFQHLLQWDQLTMARNKGEAFSEFEEGTINFAPTFKFDPGTDHYDTSSKQRVPSYTDRILFKSKGGAVSCATYDSCPLFRTSDHKPVSGIFQCKIRPGKDDVPLAAGIFNRDVYLEAIRRRRQFLLQPSLRNCPVQ